MSDFWVGFGYGVVLTAAVIWIISRLLGKEFDS